ncbi:transcription elongation factor S-II [Schizopora paradoxa]|uniref:Transcription elongation factor S-II n=1 Tax=Schizopora paradoxa TaxID=27342 RepID=A0A0H2RB05_9AGAM|nr:transcription elongation factor S-II [Schizopora paradoxa]
MSLSRSQLLFSAQAFCDAFRDAKPIDEILGHFSSTDGVVAIEHGLPQLAPFLGRNFSGLDGVKQYFETISSVLKYKDMCFSGFVVDEEARKASMKGKACFTWLSTGQSWDEVFAYTLDFDAEGKIKKYEVWADSGAAYLAGRGEL